jgi:hypothetical protein
MSHSLTSLILRAGTNLRICEVFRVLRSEQDQSRNIHILQVFDLESPECYESNIQEEWSRNVDINVGMPKK